MVDTTEEKDTKKVKVFNIKQEVNTLAWLSGDSTSLVMKHNTPQVRVLPPALRSPLAFSSLRKVSKVLDFIMTIVSVAGGLFLGTMLIDWYRKKNI